MHNNKKIRLIAFCLIATLLGAVNNGSAAGRQEFQEIRSLSYSLINHMLVYYNPVETLYDPDIGRASKADVARLEALVRQLADHELDGRLRRLSTMFIEQEHHLPQSREQLRSVNPGYSLWLPQIIEQQDQLQQRLSQLYAQQPSEGKYQAQLHNLAHDPERLLLSYKSRPSGRWAQISLYSTNRLSRPWTSPSSRASPSLRKLIVICLSS